MCVGDWGWVGGGVALQHVHSVALAVPVAGSWEMCLQDLKGCFHRTTAQFKSAHIELAVSLRFYAKLTTQFRTAFDCTLQLTRVDTLGLGRIVLPAPSLPSPLPQVRTASLASMARGASLPFPFRTLMNHHERRCFLLVRGQANTSCRDVT